MEKKRKNTIQYDPWQEDVLNASGDLCVCAARQTGKSTVTAIKATEFLVNNSNKFVLIVSTTEDQSKLIIDKMTDYLMDNYKKLVKKPFSKNVLRGQINFNNGSTVRCKAVGVGGTSIRGFKVDLLIVDEAGFMPEDVWSALTPSVWGDIILISTPKGAQGMFYEAWNDENFQNIHVTALEVYENRPISDTWSQKQRDKKIQRMELDRKRMTENNFAQEYLGRFVQDIKQFFPEELIKACMDLEFKRAGGTKEYSLGVDVARLGGDESTFEVVEKQKDGTLNHIHHESLKKVYLTATTNKILELDKHFDFRHIYIDDQGLGVGVFDYLLENPQTKRKVEAINNSARLIEYDPWKKQPRKKRLLKVDLYNNLRRLMEQGKISIMNKSDVWMSFKSVQCEWFETGSLAGSLKIYGDYTHIVEGLIRAAWCEKQKSIKPYISYI